ncbi:MAG: hypothetical protein AAFO98_05590, partial [Pseudomonadota bacterium]
MSHAEDTVASEPSVTLSWDRDRHSGYYYPQPQSREVYDSPLAPMPTATKRTRIGFTVGLNAQQLKRAFPPGYHIFAKGAEGQKMIIVATASDRYNTLYRLRALLAALTAQARTSPLFREANQPENLNFLDLARLTGFLQSTITRALRPCPFLSGMPLYVP